MKLVLSAFLLATAGVAVATTVPSTKIDEVEFRSADGRSTIKGYLFRPNSWGRIKRPAIVMLHGRSGAYSSGASAYNASSLSTRHRVWGQFWASRGYVALMVDDFGSMGRPGGFGMGTNRDRPAQFDEVVARPKHAYGALNYLQGRGDIDGNRIGLMGWSNGGSAALAAVADDGSNKYLRGFRAVVAMYPGCGLQGRFANRYKPYAPVKIHIGTADEEVSHQLCQTLAARGRRLGGDVSTTLYPGATHGFDWPSGSRAQSSGNSRAKARSEAAIEAFFNEELRDPHK